MSKGSSFVCSILEIKKMKAAKFVRQVFLILVCGSIFTAGVSAQTVTPENSAKEPEKIAKVNKNGNIDAGNQTSQTEKNNMADKPQTDAETEEDTEAVKTADYYNNYLSEYKLGPNDIISVEVFGQCPDYCKTDVTIPPTAKVSYPLIREGIFVGGRTVEQVAEEVTKKLDEYIIDPKVTVSLVKAGSARYSVMGKVNVPGVRIMDRRISINEAILEAGGLAKDGSRDKVYIARINPQGFYGTQEVNLVAIEKGEIPTIFLQPGDQVFIGGKKFTWDKFFKILGNVSAARILFGSPF